MHSQECGRKEKKVRKVKKKKNEKKGEGEDVVIIKTNAKSPGSPRPRITHLLPPDHPLPSYHRCGIPPHSLQPRFFGGGGGMNPSLLLHKSLSKSFLSFIFPRHNVFTQWDCGPAPAVP